MRGLGYHVVRGRSISYAKRLGASSFPRFHVYITRTDEGEEVLNLHLDQTASVHKGSSAHQGEYSGKLVEEEAQRIRQALQK